MKYNCEKSVKNNSSNEREKKETKMLCVVYKAVSNLRFICCGRGSDANNIILDDKSTCLWIFSCIFAADTGIHFSIPPVEFLQFWNEFLLDWIFLHGIS